MQMILTSFFVGILACSLAKARPQGNFNNYPYRPTFSDLDPYGYYTTSAPYQQNVMRIWPYIIDQAVSPLYNWNWNGNGYNGISNGYNTNGYNTNGYNTNGYNTNGYNTNGYNTNAYIGYNTNNNGYYNPYTFGYSTSSPYGTGYNPYGTISGKK